MEIQRRYSKELINLSIPIIATRIINLLADMTNGILIAHLGIAALAGYTLGISTFTTFYMISLSMLFSIGIFVSKAYARQEDMTPILSGAFILSSFLSLIVIILLWASPFILTFFNQNIEIVNLTTPYFNALIFGIFPMFWGIVLSQYLIGIHKAKIVTWISLITLPINIIIAYILLFKANTHNPLSNISGAGYANSLTAWLRFLLLFSILFSQPNVKEVFKACFFLSKKQMAYLKPLINFGWPLSLQYGGEIAILTVATYFIGHLDYRYLASQQVSSQFRIISMMIPFGIAQAASILVARELAIKNKNHAYEMGRAALKFGFIIMTISSCLCILFSNQIIRVYISYTPANQHVINMARFFLYIAAISQLFDTLKIISGGILRGYSDTIVPMVLGLLSLGIIGLPLSYYLGYWTTLGTIGIPLGLLIGFVLSAFFLINRFKFKTQVLAEANTR